MKKVKTGMALLLAAALLVFFGCNNGTTPLPDDDDDDDTPVLSNDAGLSSISLNSAEGELADPVPRSEWESGNFNVAAMPLSYLYAATLADLTQATVTATPSNSKATVLYALGTASAKPTAWEESGEFALNNNDYVYIAVTAENQQDRNFYKALAFARTSEARLGALTIGGNEGITAPAASLTDVVLQAVRIEYGTGNVQIEAEPLDSRATIQFAKAAYEDLTGLDPATDLTWVNEPAFSLSEGDLLYVKCTSPDEESTLYCEASGLIPRSLLRFEV